MTASAREPKLTKTTGESEPFRESKLRSSLARSGADREQVREIVAAVKQRLRDGMPTDEVFKIARRMLQKEHRDAAARYSLQRAIQELGPDGFPFERFIAELWRHDGFSVRTGALMKGRLVRHDVDLYGHKDDERRLGECKFRAHNDGKVDIKIALYVHARAADLRAAADFDEFWLITNGRFTRDALNYGEGVGLRMLAWNHPVGDGLRERIDRSGLHPVTALSSLHKTEQKKLLQQGVVLGSTLRRRAGLVAELGLGDARKKALWAEIDGLCADETPAEPRPRRRRRGSRGGRGRRSSAQRD
ncbi:MAG: ATP cone domain-containing protein [Planctomycetota bacterium]